MIDSPAIPECASKLRKQMMLLVRRLRRETTPMELPLSQLLLLSRIEQLGDDATPTMLAEQEGLRPQNLSALLRKLEEAGLVARAGDEQDRRKSRVHLSMVGMQVLTDNRNNRDNWLAQAMSASLTTDEINLLREAGPLLERLAACGETAPSPQEKQALTSPLILDKSE
jgi:DNA-binding MarR family transcriptional regulator